MKKLIVISYIIILLLSLTACISDVERKNGKEDVREGKKLIKEYVRETYGKKAKASEFKPIYIRESYDSTVPNLSKIASGYVKATVSINHAKFDILYNVHTNEVLSKENIQTVQDSFLTYANDILQSDKLIDCEMTLYSREKDDGYISGFIEPDIMTYEDLVSTGEYSIKLTYRSINSNFDTITEEKWEQLIVPFLTEDTERKVYLIVVNYTDEETYKLGADQDYFDYINQEIPYYQTEEAAESAKNIVYMDSQGVIDVLNLHK